MSRPECLSSGDRVVGNCQTWETREEQGSLNRSVRADFSPGRDSVQPEISLFLPPAQEAASRGGFICFSKKGEVGRPCTCCLLDLKLIQQSSLWCVVSGPALRFHSGLTAFVRALCPHWFLVSRALGSGAPGRQ